MKKILLIEDDTVIRENTAEILSLARYDVVTAKNGKEGTYLAKEVLPDLIVCDILMPELDGYGVLHILSKDPKTASIPFIFLTAKTEKNEIRKGMELGADDYLTKPFEETELLNAIECRLRKNESLKKEFSKNLEGLNQFLDEASNFKELTSLSKKCPVIHYKRKEIIFHQGHTPDHLFFVAKGHVKEYKAHDNGKEYVVGMFQKGEFFGFSPLFENTDYTDSAVAMEDSQVCHIPKADFLALVYKNKAVARQFIRMLSNNVSENEKKLMSLAFDSVRKRVATTLLGLSARLETRPNKMARVSIGREDLAGLVGTATETVIRSIGELKDDHLIDVDGRDIIILNAEGLQEIQ